MALKDSIKRKILVANITQSMSEGVIFSGKEMQYLNSAAEKMLGLKVPAGKSIIACLAEKKKNEELTEAIITAIYDKEKTHENVVPYTIGNKKYYYHVKSSVMTFRGKTEGVIILLEDVTELLELRETAQYTETIKNLNTQLEEKNEFLNKVFGKYLSDELVKKILKSPEGIEMGGRKHNLTVLMSDLRGFSAMSESMEAQDLLSMLNHYLGEMAEITHKYHGTIIEFIGDGILVVFGRPIKVANHAENAVCAAIEMQNKMDEVNAWNAERGYPFLEMGIGINTGNGIAGNIGCERHVKYGVTGSLVNLCGRIENYTVGGQILIGPGTKKAIQTTLAVDQEMTVHPKGFAEPIVISQVTGIGKPYCLHYEAPDIEPRVLKTPISFKFSVIRDKIVEKDVFEGTVIALSHTSANIQTKKELELYDNLQITTEKGEVIFGKVVKIREKDIRIRFTYKAKE